MFNNNCKTVFKFNTYYLSSCNLCVSVGVGVCACLYLRVCVCVLCVTDLQNLSVYWLDRLSHVTAILQCAFCKCVCMCVCVLHRMQTIRHAVACVFVILYISVDKGYTCQYS